MESGRKRWPAGKDELAQWRQGRLVAIDAAFELLDLRGRDGGSGARWARRRRQLGAQVEQPVLDVIQQRGKLHILGLRADEPQMGVQLIDGAVRLDTQVVFWHTPAADQSGLAAVARPGVDSRPGGSSRRAGAGVRALRVHAVPQATAGSRTTAAAGWRR